MDPSWSTPCPACLHHPHATDPVQLKPKPPSSQKAFLVTLPLYSVCWPLVICDSRCPSLYGINSYVVLLFLRYLCVPSSDKEIISFLRDRVIAILCSQSPRQVAGPPTLSDNLSMSEPNSGPGTWHPSGTVTAGYAHTPLNRSRLLCSEADMLLAAGSHSYGSERGSGVGRGRQGN